jgi:uncharacterized protein YggE
MEIPQESSRKFYKTLVILGIILSLYFAVKFLSEVRSYNMMGSSGANTITLTGHGEVQAVPDIATINFSIESSETTQAIASEKVNTKTKNVLEFLNSSGIAEKDIKTDNYSSYPKYSNPDPCPIYYQGGIMPPCRVGESKIIGYTVSQGITVKIRKVDDAPKIIDGINKIGVTNMYGPNLAIDDEDALKAIARKEAIDDAREKAKVLAKDLGVRLGRITSFNESADYPYPIMYNKAMSADAGAMESAPAQIPKGENTISSDVTITYEIR